MCVRKHVAADQVAPSSRGVVAGSEGGCRAQALHGGGIQHSPSLGNQRQPPRTEPKTAQAQMSDAIGSSFGLG